MFFSKKQKPANPLHSKITLGMLRERVVEILTAENMLDVGMQVCAPDDMYSSKVYARQIDRSYIFNRTDRHYLYYFDKNKKLVKIGEIPIFPY